VEVAHPVPDLIAAALALEERGQHFGLQARPPVLEVIQRNEVVHLHHGCADGARQVSGEGRLTSTGAPVHGDEAQRLGAGTLADICGQFAEVLLGHVGRPVPSSAT